MKPLYEGNKHINIVPRAKTKPQILLKQVIPSLIPWLAIYKSHYVNGDNMGNKLQMFISEFVMLIHLQCDNITSHLSQCVSTVQFSKPKRKVTWNVVTM
jgi:hypothetical protein